MKKLKLICLGFAFVLSGYSVSAHAEFISVPGSANNGSGGSANNVCARDTQKNTDTIQALRDARGHDAKMKKIMDARLKSEPASGDCMLALLTKGDKDIEEMLNQRIALLLTDIQPAAGGEETTTAEDDSELPPIPEEVRPEFTEPTETPPQEEQKKEDLPPPPPPT